MPDGSRGLVFLGFSGLGFRGFKGFRDFRGLGFRCSMFFHNVYVMVLIVPIKTTLLFVSVACNILCISVASVVHCMWGGPKIKRSLCGEGP